jgi:hypothetical protein
MITKKTRRRDSGRYAHAHDRLCTCGHMLGMHTADATENEQPCLILDCPCEKFTPARKV